MATSLASNRDPIPKAKVRAYVLEQFEKGCTCWHTHMRDHVWNHFKSVEKDVAETAIQEKVSVKLSKKVIMNELRTLFADKEKQSLIYDKQKHGGQRNQCELHPSVK